MNLSGVLLRAMLSPLHLDIGRSCMLICSSRDHEPLCLVYIVALKVLVPESALGFQKFNCFSHELDYTLSGSLEGS